MAAMGGPDFEALAQELEEQVKLLEARLANSGGWSINDWMSAIKVYAIRAKLVTVALRRAKGLETSAAETLNARQREWSAERRQLEADLESNAERKAQEAWNVEREKLVADINVLRGRLAEIEAKHASELGALRKGFDAERASARSEVAKLSEKWRQRYEDASASHGRELAALRENFASERANLQNEIALERSAWRKRNEDANTYRMQELAARTRVRELLSLLGRAERVIAENDTEEARDVWEAARTALLASTDEVLQDSTKT